MAVRSVSLHMPPYELTCRFHTQNILQRCNCHHSIYKTLYCKNSSKTLFAGSNPADHLTSWCMSLDTLFHRKRYLTGLSRWRSTHEWDRCAVQLSRSGFLPSHCGSIRPVLTLKTYKKYWSYDVIPHIGSLSTTFQIQIQMLITLLQ